MRRLTHCVRAATLAALAGAAAAWAAGPERPNILFILTDDQGYGDVGRHGNPVLKTPNLDALRDQSVRFTDFCVSSSCSPTRAALMSGMFSLRVGVTHTIAPRCRLDPKVTILPQVLKPAGYATACIGKWHLSADAETEPGRRGFDYVAGKPAHFQDGRYREDILFDEAMGFMERSAGRPFFCYLATWSPHAPLIVPDKYVEPYRGKVDDNTAQFLGMVANIDENVGRILRWLDEKGLAKSTVVILMNDNGGTYGVDTWNAGMRGCKCTAWPGGARALSFWRWPGRGGPRATSARSRRTSTCCPRSRRWPARRCRSRARAGRSTAAASCPFWKAATTRGSRSAWCSSTTRAGPAGWRRSTRTAWPACAGASTCWCAAAPAVRPRASRAG